jgi:hypothetical protein
MPNAQANRTLCQMAMSSFIDQRQSCGLKLDPKSTFNAHTQISVEKKTKTARKAKKIQSDSASSV